MGRFLFSIMLSIISVTAFAQKEGYVWAFGTNAGFDFNSGSPVPIQTAINGFGEGNATVCSKTGELLFYTEGSIVWDRNGNIMPNGNNLTGLSYPLSLGETATSSCTQGALIVPMPDSASKYYVFSLTEVEESALAGRLYYSVVDMSLNGGMGDIEPGRKGIIMDSALTEKMTAVVGDRCDVWLLVHALKSVSFKAYEITDAGINFTPVISNVGVFATGNYQVGPLKASPDGKKLVVANSYSGLELCSFDPATGNVSNAIKLANGSFYGAAFSPDNSKLYVGEYTNLVTDQFDVSSGVAATITASETVIDHGGGFADMKTAPDGKIYDGVGNVIELPNAAGYACNFTLSYQSGVTLLPGTHFGEGLPNAVAVIVRDTLPPTQQVVKACFTDSMILYANDSGWNYKWDDGSIETYRTVYSSGNYVVHYFTPPCTYHTDTFNVAFEPLPSTGSLPGCYGHHEGKAWVQPQAGDTSQYTFVWTDTSGTQLQLPVTGSGIGDTLRNEWPGTYLINIHSRGGCDTSLPVVIDTPQYSGYIHVTDTAICPHDTIMLQASGGVAYHWFADSNTYISDTTIANPKVSPPTDWSYIVCGANTSGCLDTVTAHVKVYPNAVVQLPDSVVLYYGDSYQFSPQTNCTIFNWFPPSGLSATDISNPVASPSVNTRYVVTATTENGCTIKDSINMYRDDEILLTLPNAFTPGNGSNNLFIPIHRGDVMLDYLRIYNRWGEMIYESNDIDQGWDGSYRGMPQPQGVYIYSMEGHTTMGRRLVKQGNVTLIR